ncbi:hypothetical protein AMECASPLE_007361 [Ameca splendens]|uniref:Uncharacterized protein n=1 Tax=Ameca splendens TaxID=208324 RepID=A0ABV0YBI8_9TELE
MFFFGWCSSGPRSHTLLSAFSPSPLHLPPVRQLDDLLSSLAVTVLCDFTLPRESNTSAFGVVDTYQCSSLLPCASIPSCYTYVVFLSSSLMSSLILPFLCPNSILSASPCVLPSFLPFSCPCLLSSFPSVHLSFLSSLSFLCFFTFSPSPLLQFCPSFFLLFCLCHSLLVCLVLVSFLLFTL